MTSDLEVEMQYHMLSLGRRKIQYDLHSCNRYRDSLAMLDLAYAQKKLEIDRDQRRILHGLRVERLDQLRQRLEAQVQGAKGLERDSLRIELEKLLLRKAQAEQAAPSTRDDEVELRKEDQLFQLDNWRDAERARLLSNLEFSGHGFGWLSLNYGVASRSFRLFDRDASPEGQVERRSYATQRLGVTYTYYYRTAAARESYYASFGVDYEDTDNLEQLKKREITDTETIAGAPNERALTQKYTAYEGDYRDHVRSLLLGADLFAFLFLDNAGAIHVFPSHRMAEHAKPTTNVVVGLLLGFKSKDNKEKPGNRVNTEIFVEFVDLANTRQSGDSTLERSRLGLRVAFPINF